MHKYKFAQFMMHYFRSQMKLGVKKPLKFILTADFIAFSEMKDAFGTADWLDVIKFKADLSPCIHLQRRGKLQNSRVRISCNSAQIQSVMFRIEV